jgi:hypothetical protein
MTTQAEIDAAQAALDAATPPSRVELQRRVKATTRQLAATPPRDHADLATMTVAEVSRLSPDERSKALAA